MKSLGEALLEARKNKRLTIREAAKGIGISRQYLKFIETDVRTSISFDIAIRISDFYGIPLDVLKGYIIQKIEGKFEDEN